ncbi:MAG TPA: hypothetical protein VE046_16505 [Steroidobacteraceae bacterium]|nr:hypothetical protein [Steroidobacteraceae bacterium]
MNAKSWPMLLTLCVPGCAGEKPYDHDLIQIQGRPGVMYKRGDGREVIECESRHVPGGCGSLETSGITEQVFSDCSDEQFECLFNSADVLAIPKAGLTVGQKYTAFGANLTVEQCFGDQASCGIAVIKSACADVQTCSCRSTVQGRATTFYFSRELGITAFYTIGAPAAVGVDSKMLAEAIPLLTYVLVAEKGFLRASLALPRATLGTNCRN